VSECASARVRKCVCECVSVQVSEDGVVSERVHLAVALVTGPEGKCLEMIE
jgi:hypothetical protein